jgi:hypothetical protein
MNFRKILDVSIDTINFVRKIGRQEQRMIKVIQAAIRDSGLPQLEIARRAGIAAGQLSRFMRNERTLTLPAAEKICRVVGLHLVPIKKRKAR